MSDRCTVGNAYELYSLAPPLPMCVFFVHVHPWQVPSMRFSDESRFLFRFVIHTVNLSPSIQLMGMLACSPNDSANSALAQISARAPAELRLKQAGQRRGLLS